ncbi:hypothetical protein AVEN_148950-1 [Araneus ventricosus]|uniref:Uncharacterized protein n=1 Tax=Araneus ventricosus TaxID=182803 RepID=A0A4Y2FN83_ARAVE|nr:hypothetical protein AVEN_148950-1 [Araneus ventricosus]
MESLFSAILALTWRPFWRRKVGPQKCWNFLDISGSGFIQMISCDVTACRGDYKRIVLGSQRIESIDRMVWPLECERLWNLSLSAVRTSKLIDAERY